jgi:RHS repeat-associated protein
VLYELNGKAYVPIHDHRGCVVVLVDLQTKKSIESYRYSAFGEELTHNTFSPWRFASKRVDEETDLVFFGRRYYHPILGRFITRDPEGFEDGPNLYAYLHNNPLTDFDLYGLFSWRNMWGGTRDFFEGAWDYAKGGAYGMGYGLGKMGEWMHADFQYEYFNDRSFFQDKSYRATEGWKNLGRAAWNDPLGMVVPGVMEAWRNPISPRAWGKAAVDVSMIGFSAVKLCGPIANIGRAGKIGEEFSIFSKTGNVVGDTFKVTKNGLATWRNPETLADHFMRHGKDFGTKNAPEYAHKASNFLLNSQKRKLPTKIGPDGTIRVFDPQTNTFGSYSPDGRTRTFYKLDSSKHGYPTNTDYWNMQPGNFLWIP